MAEAKIRRLFLGGNTARGFRGFPHSIADDGLKRTFVIKGGPGVGKSTLMRRIAEGMRRRGYDVELFYCSSDPGSLDGVRAPGLGVSLVDGTAPHVLDPAHPGAVDEIVNLGEHWDEAGMRRARVEVVRLFSEVARLFRRAYACLGAAHAVREQLRAGPTDAGALDTGGLNAEATALCAFLLDGVPEAGRGEERHAGRGCAPGRVRHLFATAITPDGLMGFLDDVAAPLARRAVLLGPPGTGKSRLAAKLAAAAQERGLDVEVFHCGLDSDRVEHVVIPARGAGLITAAPPHHYRPDGGDVIVDTSRFLDPLPLAALAPEADQLSSLYERALDAGVGFLARAKRAHDELETHYVPHMDFAAVESTSHAILSRILGSVPAEAGAAG